MLEGLRSEIRGYYADGSVHGWEHAERVEGMARRIAEAEGGADLEVVRLGAIMHDIGRRKEDAGEIDDHASCGASEARAILGGYGYGVEKTDAVARCVETHRYSDGPEPDTVEACIVADADDLDALGAVGIARTFGHGGGFDATAEHIREKLLSLTDAMRTDAGREIAEDRDRFTQRFLRRFESERNGEEAQGRRRG